MFEQLGTDSSGISASFLRIFSPYTDKRQLFKLVCCCWLEVMIGATMKLASKFRGAVNRINVITESHKSECSPDSHNSERDRHPVQNRSSVSKDETNVVADLC